MPGGLQPPSKRYQQQYPQQAPMGIQMSNHQPHRVHYPIDTIQQTFQQFPQSQKQPRVSLSVTLPDQIHSPSYLPNPPPAFFPILSYVPLRNFTLISLLNCLKLQFPISLRSPTSSTNTTIYSLPTSRSRKSRPANGICVWIFKSLQVS